MTDPSIYSSAFEDIFGDLNNLREFSINNAKISDQKFGSFKALDQMFDTYHGTINSIYNEKNKRLNTEFQTSLLVLKTLKETLNYSLEHSLPSGKDTISISSVPGNHLHASVLKDSQASVSLLLNLILLQYSSLSKEEQASFKHQLVLLSSLL